MWEWLWEGYRHRWEVETFCERLAVESLCELVAVRLSRSATIPVMQARKPVAVAECRFGGRTFEAVEAWDCSGTS